MPSDYEFLFPDIFASAAVEESYFMGLGTAVGSYLFLKCLGLIFDFIEFLVKRKRNSPPCGEDKNKER